MESDIPLGRDRHGFTEYGGKMLLTAESQIQSQADKRIVRIGTHDLNAPVDTDMGNVGTDTELQIVVKKLAQVPGRNAAGFCDTGYGELF